MAKALLSAAFALPCSANGLLAQRATLAEVSPPLAPHPADATQFDRWRAQIRSALFIDDPLPTLDTRSFGTFAAASDVTAERVLYGTEFGMRVPAIIYRPTKAAAVKLPALVVVNGHGGDKYSWYSMYTGILYARAGGIVLTYDPIGEGERNLNRKSGTREHDHIVNGPHTGPRLGGLMVTDAMQAVSYLLSRPDVDPQRIAVAGYSMGSFISAIAGAVDPRIHALILSGGGDLDGNGGYWDSSSKLMCQGRPYQALSFLSDKAAVLYALNERRGPTLVVNGTADTVVDIPHHMQPFFDGLRTRTIALTGTRTNLFENLFIPDAGHRPNWVTRPVALWLQDQLRYPDWDRKTIEALPETHVIDWANKNHVDMDKGYTAEISEGGIMALRDDVKPIPRADLNVLTDKQFEAEKSTLVYESWIEHALDSDGVTGTAAQSAVQVKQTKK